MSQANILHHEASLDCWYVNWGRMLPMFT